MLRRQRRQTRSRLAEAEAERDAVMGADSRTRIESKLRTLQRELDRLDAEIERLERRDDATYDKWRDNAHARRYALPAHETILDVEFALS